ncbi:MAG: zinc transporter ZupT [Porphyromonas sp.]|nr:zinc transporter ZupT [Porphyromonas sp.]
MDNQVLIAFGLTLLAGLSTGIGSAIAFLSKQTNKVLLSVSLGLSAGVMIYISFVELLAIAFTDLASQFGETVGQVYTVLSFFAGILFIMLIDFLVPEKENPHEPLGVEDAKVSKKPLEHADLKRVGVITALVLAIHNFPEGMVTFLSGLKSIGVAIPIAIAVAIHNIPEGISVSIPIYYATGDKKKAFWTSFASGLAEPIGALVGYLILAPILNDTLMACLNAVIAGIMVYISLDELLPTAAKYGKHHHSILGVVLGMALMAFSLIIL